MSDGNNDYIKEEDDDESSGDEELGEDNYKTQKDAVLFAIHISDSMLAAPAKGSAKKGDRDSAVTAALKCAYQFMEQRIICSPKDMMAVLLFGAEKTKFHVEGTYQNCYLFTDMDVPAAEDVRALKALAEEGEDDEGALRPMQAPDDAEVSRMLYAANHIFTTKAANFTSRRLFIITDKDQPQMDKQAKGVAVTRAKDLYDLNVGIELFPITRGDDTFDTSKFYDDIVYRAPAAEANMAEVRTSRSTDGLSLLSSLISNVNSRQTAKRALFSNLGFEIAPGLKISVNGYNILHRQQPQRSCYIWLDGETPQIAVGETARIAEHSARTVDKSEIKKAYKFGGEFVHFTPAEQKELRDFGGPIIRILGFKPRSMLPPWAAVAKSIFIFPTEVDYIGSTRVFVALWQKLLRDDKVGIAWAVTRANTAPRLMAVIPSREKTAEELGGSPYLPVGLWLYPIPFADDVRSVNGGGADDYLEASSSLKTKMRVVVQQLQLPKAMYNPTKYPNPALQWHYKILQALALEEEIPDRADDPTEPKYKAISKRAGGYIQAWDAALKEETDKVISTQRTAKRKSEDDGDDEPQPKKAKAGAAKKVAGSALTDGQVKAAVESGGISKMTVVQLKEVLTARGLSTAGRKQEIVERIEDWAGAN